MLTADRSARDTSRASPPESVARVQALLARIAQLGERLNCFTQVYHAAALAAAADRDAHQPRGPLHGLALVYKDVVDLAGHPTSAGSRVLGHQAIRTAPLVRRLEAAGTITLAKTQLVEGAFGGFGTNALFGTPWNPWDATRHRVPGGSSSGAAVALAAGLADAAIGTDTGGSVRIPAALCGVVGFKPAGGISRRGVVLLSDSLDTVGPLAHSVAEVARLYAVLAARTPPAPAASLRGRCLGCLADRDLEGTAPDVAAAYRRALDQLAAAGAQIKPFAFPDAFDDYVEKNGVLIGYEGWRRHGARILAATQPMDPSVRERFLAGSRLSDAAYHAARRQRRRDQRQILARLAGLDAVLTPTTPITAIPVAEVDESCLTLSRYTRLVNYLGLCALAVPAGLDRQGLPVSLQWIGRAGEEEHLLALGAAYEALRGEFPRPDLKGFDLPAEPGRA